MKHWASYPIWAKIAGLLGALAALVAIASFLGYPTAGSFFSRSDDLKGELTNANELSAPRVTFASGETCWVKYSVDFELPEENVLSVAKQFGLEDRAINDLLSSTQGALLAVLEGKSLSYVRANRTPVEQEIAEVSSSKIFSPGYLIHGVDLHEILC